jgi:hypothetical protein
MDKPLTDEFYLSAVENKLAQGKRNTYLLVLLSALCIGLGCGLIYYQGMQPQAVRLGGFLLLGFVFATAMCKKASEDYPFLAAMLVSVFIQLCVLAFSFATKSLDVKANVTYAAAFLLPVAMMQSWYLFKAIPRRRPRIWFASGKLPEKPPFAYFDSRRIRLKVVQEGEPIVALTVAAPGEMKLGMAFYYGIKEQNEQANEKLVRFVDENGRPHAWVFYTRSFGWRKKYLDPEENLFENQLGSNALVIAECIH